LQVILCDPCLSALYVPWCEKSLYKYSSFPFLPLTTHWTFCFLYPLTVSREKGHHCIYISCMTLTHMYVQTYIISSNHIYHTQMTSFTDEIKSINTIKLTVMASEYTCTQALCPECPANYSAHSFKQNICTTEVATDDELYKLFQLY